jgi:hypothetical protein
VNIGDIYKKSILYLRALKITFLINMKLKHYGALATGMIISLAVVMALPPFLQQETRQQILLSFSISSNENLPKWCDELASTLFEKKIKAVVFVSGEIAQEFPQCITSFSKNVDIGSQAFHYSPITKISNYSIQLDEIKKGKKTIDEIGNLDSKLFKAPYGKTDDNIYSLLNRSDIVVDFSYVDQYNQFQDDKFIWFKINSYNSDNYKDSLISTLSKTGSKENKIPTVIDFDEKISIIKINDMITDLKNQDVELVNASDLVGFDLTNRFSTAGEST